MRTGSFFSRAGCASSMSLLSSALSSSWFCSMVWCRMVPGTGPRLHEHVAQVDAVRLPTLDRFVLVEAFDMADGLFQGAEAELGEQLAYFLGDEHEEVDDMFRLALEACAQFGSWVAMPCGQVFFWQARIMTQPSTISAAVAKPNSSAPSRAAITTSRPVLSSPSHCTVMRERRPLSTSVCWVSDRPISTGCRRA